MWTNEKVQSKFTEAIEYLKPRVQSIEDEIVLNALTYFKMYSASGNDIPGLAGLGLHEMLDLAYKVLEGHRVRVNPRYLSKAFQINY